MTVVSRYTGGFVELAPGHVEELRTQLRGELVLPGDAHYDKARTVWNAAIDKRPAMIARCADASGLVHEVDDRCLAHSNTREPCASLRKLLSSYGIETDNVHEEVERPLLVAYPQDNVVDVHGVASQFPVD